MRTQQNVVYGTCCFLAPGEDPGKLPPKHRELLTPALLRAFADPAGYFGAIADRCGFPNMAAWLRKLIQGEWELALHRTGPPVGDDWTAAGILFRTPAVCGAEIEPPAARVSKRLPAALQQYFALVGAVSWEEFGVSGGLDGPTDHESLTEFGYGGPYAEVDPRRTFAFGRSICGDSLIYTKDGRAGWWCHGDDTIRLVGTIEELIEWIYGELLAKRHPEYHYGD